MEVLRAALINGDRSHSQAINPTCEPPAPEVSSTSALCSAPRPTTPLSSFHPPDRRIRLRAPLSSSHERLPSGADHGPRLRGGQVWWRGPCRIVWCRVRVGLVSARLVHAVSAV